MTKPWRVTDGSGIGSNGKREGRLLEDVAEGAALEVAEIPASGAVGPPDEVFANSAKLAPDVSLAESSSALAWAAAMSASLAFSGVGIRISLRCTCSGTVKLLSMCGVVSLLISVGHVEMATHFIAHDLLPDDLIADVLLEILKGDALLSGGLLELLHGGKVVFLADVVELVHGSRRRR